MGQFDNCSTGQYKILFQVLFWFKIETPIRHRPEPEAIQGYAGQVINYTRNEAQGPLWELFNPCLLLSLIMKAEGIRGQGKGLLKKLASEKDLTENA